MRLWNPAGMASPAERRAGCVANDRSSTGVPTFADFSNLMPARLRALRAVVDSVVSLRWLSIGLSGGDSNPGVS